MSDTPDAGPLLPECEFAADIPRDSQGCLPVGALTAASGCRIAQAECFTLMSPDNFGAKRKKEKHMAKSPKKPVVEEPPPPAEEAVEADGAAEEKTAPLPGPPQAPAAVQAHVEVPASPSALPEVQALLPKDGSAGSMITVMLALITVAGGGAGWKFYQSFAKQKHEQRMKELELKEKRLDDKNDHKACEAARLALEGRLAALEAKQGDAAPAPAVSLPFDPEELEQRLSEIEKVLKKDISKKPKKG